VSVSLHATYFAGRLATTLGYARMPLDVLLRRIAAKSPLEASRRAAAQLAPVVVRCEALSSRSRLLPDTCLYRALARFALLRSRGADATFVLALPSGGRGDGHAWVEVDGAPWLEDEDLSSMHVTFCYPPAPARTFANPAQRRAP